jgi:glycosyltransferase involved in cell wall biosynthesis
MNPPYAKISVIIPTYNHARYLPDSIESALGQTLKPHEVIVVDDGSVDNTSEVVGRYPVTYLRPPHGGLSAARNAGIRASTGDWIAPLDADDYWLPRKLELQAAAARQAPFCYCATNMFYTDGHTEFRPYYDHGQVKTILRHHNCIDPSAVLIRKDLLVQVGGFNESMPAAEDWEAWLKLARVCDFVGVPEPLLMYRVTGTGMGADPDIVMRSMDAVVEAGTADLPPLRRYVEARRMRSVRTALAAVKYRDRGDYDKTLRYAWRAFAHWPSPFYDRAFKVLLLELGRRVRSKT